MKRIGTSTALVAAFLAAACGGGPPPVPPPSAGELNPAGPVGADALTRPNPIAPVALVLVTPEDEARYGPWPFRRSIHAEVIRFLAGAGARVILVDIIFSEEADTTSDAALAEAIRSSPVPVVLSASLCQAPSASEGADVAARAVDVRLHGEIDISARPALFPHRRLREAGPRIGFSTVFLEENGMLLHLPLLIEYGGRWYPSLALAGALVATGETRPIDLWPRERLEMAGTRFDLAQISSWTIHWTPPGRLPRRSYDEILSGQANPVDFRGAVILVGYDGEAFNDRKPTPVHNAYPGTEIQACALNNLLNRIAGSRD